MRLVFPNSTRVNRGNYVVKELAEACRANEVTDLIILHEHRGTPGESSLVFVDSYSADPSFSDAMIISHFPHGPTFFFTLSNVSLRHDIASYGQSTVSEQYPHLIFENFSSRLGYRVRDALKHLFPVPKEDAKRVMTFANESDFISFRFVMSDPSGHSCTNKQALSHHVFVKTSHKEVQLAEVGPRFEMKRRNSLVTTYYMLMPLYPAYEIRLGTIEQKEADKEWVLAYYTRAARKRRQL